MGQLVCRCPTATHEPDCPNRQHDWHYVGLTMYRGARREHVACPSTETAYLAAVDPGGAELRCCLLDDHYGPHEFHMEWTDPTHDADWTGSLPGEPPSCSCGYNGTPEECSDAHTEQKGAGDA